MTAMYMAFPYRIDFAGRTAVVDLPAYVEGLVIATLSTGQGERVNRPTFGGGLQQFVFALADSHSVASAQTLLHSTIIQWLSDIVTLQALTVDADGIEMVVRLTYVVDATEEVVTQIVRSGPTP